MPPSRRVIATSTLALIVALIGLSIFRVNGPADAGPAKPSPKPSATSSTFSVNVLSTGDGAALGKVGESIRLPPGVDTQEETLAYLQSLANPSPPPSPSAWSAADPIPPGVSVIAILERRGIDPEEFLREYYKGKESVDDLIERLATR